MNAQHLIVRPVLRLLTICPLLLTAPAGSEKVSLTSQLNSNQASTVDYDINIEGEIITPTAEGSQRFTLKSDGEFQFHQQPVSSSQSGPESLAALRTFTSAATKTTVGKDHVTKMTLPAGRNRIYVSGQNDHLVSHCKEGLLSRNQLDLIQMPFDPIGVNSVLATTPLEVGEKWNTDSWLMPMLTGIETALEQTATCTLVSVKKDEVIVQFTGKITGAVHGSAANVTYSGELTLDRKHGLIRSFIGQQKEKRTPGPVSPGLDITANISWTQTPRKRSDTPAEFSPPTEDELQLVIETPFGLRMHHSREWHLFHETASLTMMRQIRNGELMTQCNISTGTAVPPGEHTPNRTFANDVLESISGRSGKVDSEETIREDSDWRIRLVRASGTASGNRVRWDYYLCSAGSGEQFSIMFSHSQNDETEFQKEVATLLSTLSLAKKR